MPTSRRARLLACLALGAGAGACAADATVPDPNDGLLRDFVDGKFDGAGHPINARVTDAATLCPDAGPASDGTVGAVQLDTPCEGAAAGVAQHGDLQLGAHLRVGEHGDGDLAVVSVLGAGGVTLASETLTAARLRDATWIDLPVAWASDGSDVRVRVEPAAGARVELAYVEVFPRRFGLALAPGSGVLDDTARITIELPPNHALQRVELDGADVTARLDELVTSGAATRTTTDFRTVLDVAVGDLAPGRGDVAELRIHTDADAARMELRRAPAPCAFTGDAAGAKVLITGFQPFPADGWHDNVSEVAVTALDPKVLHGARVMKLILPVEYDLAAAAAADAIARCAPDVVISFGQGGDEIALEQTAYNLQDTGEVSGGVPDNRGVVRAAVPIDVAAPATRATLLPLDAIAKAIRARGETPARSTDPGRYICNNVFFADVGAVTAAAHGRAGFIHLPYTTDFDDATRARFAGVVAAAIQATVDAP